MQGLIADNSDGEAVESRVGSRTWGKTERSSTSVFQPEHPGADGCTNPAGLLRPHHCKVLSDPGASSPNGICWCQSQTLRRCCARTPCPLTAPHPCWNAAFSGGEKEPSGSGCPSALPEPCRSWCFDVGWTGCG